MAEIEGMERAAFFPGGTGENQFLDYWLSF